MRTEQKSCLIQLYGDDPGLYVSHGCQSIKGININSCIVCTFFGKSEQKEEKLEQSECNLYRWILLCIHYTY